MFCSLSSPAVVDNSPLEPALDEEESKLDCGFTTDTNGSIFTGVGGNLWPLA